jgi:N-acetylmuramoyl-L-alanine amidase
VKRLLLAAVLFFAFAGTAEAAAPVQMVVRDVLPRPVRAPSSATPKFNLVGLHWQGRGTPSFRTRSVAGRWSKWVAADADWGRVGVWRRSDAVWTGAADSIQVRPGAGVTRVREYLVWSPPFDVPTRWLQLAGSPLIVPRSGWRADESIRRQPPKYAPTLQLAVVHHTATANGYSCAQSASIVRGIEVYHVKGNGWNDIGYNFLVDACGQVFEGRYGGIDRNVIGAHSGGFNTGSVGVSVIGNYARNAPSKAAQDALVKLLAWRLDVGHVDPLAQVAYVSGGNSKFPAGRRVALRAISGHRDTYLTSCPGAALYGLLPGIAAKVAQTGLPKLYTPRTAGAIGGPIRFTARLTTALPWTVTVSDASGELEATGSGVGTNIDWTWDATLAVPGVPYTWVISAGATTRAAVGVLGGTLPALALTNVQVTPAILDGVAVPSSTVSYTLSTPANVTAELVDPNVSAVTLFTQNKNAGTNTFIFTPTGLADGNYEIRLTARDLFSRQTTAAAPVVVSRTLLSFSADSKVISPNGDGRHDTVLFKFLLAQPASVSLQLISEFALVPLVSAQLQAGAQSFMFTGMGVGNTPLLDGDYAARLTVGTVGRSLPLTIDRLPPTVTIVSISPLRLRVAERVTLIATINGREIRASVQPGVVRLAKNETVRSLSVVARDAAGNESEPITYQQKR